MRIRVHGTITRVRGPREEQSKSSCRLVRLLPLFTIVVIVGALGILAVSEISLMGKRTVPGVVTSGGAASRIMPSRSHYRSLAKPNNRHKETKEDKTLVFKLEPLIKMNAASVELSAQGILNHLRSGIINGYISQESHQGPPTPHRSQVNRNIQDCPIVPPELKGKRNVSLSNGEVKGVHSGGWWMPQNCSSRHAVAIVIPYRDRESQLETLMGFLHPILQRQLINYRIFVVEQEGNDTFNKGVLMNAGFMTALKKPLEPGVLYHCFVFHDVDMLLEDDRNLYTCPQQPRHMSVAVNELDYRLPYRELVGGVFAIRTDHFLRVNGYSNLYWGWGGEDDDMGYRVEHLLYSISRPPEWIARYTMIKHEKRRPLAWKVRVKLTRTWRRYKYDGLNTLQYKLVGVEEAPLYTRVVVDVGHPPSNIRMLQEEEERKRSGAAQQQASDKKTLSAS